MYQSDRSLTTVMAGTEASKQKSSKTYPSLRATCSIWCFDPSPMYMCKAPKQTIQGFFMPSDILLVSSMAVVGSHSISAVDVFSLPLVFLEVDDDDEFSSARSKSGLGIEPAKSMLRTFKKRRTHRVQTCKTTLQYNVNCKKINLVCLLSFQIRWWAASKKFNDKARRETLSRAKVCKFSFWKGACWT